MVQPGLRDWKPCTPVDALAWLGPVRVPWWVAGGWALDLHRGEPTRPHGDLDVGCFREDLQELRSALPGWTVSAARRGRLYPLDPTEAPGDDVHSLWCRPAGAREWWLEIMLDERDGDAWVYRRSREIRMPARSLVRRDRDGVPYLRPEVQLLYKAKDRRPRDEQDFRTTLPRLEEAARRWLREALARTQPEHPWLLPLAAA